MRKTYVDRRRWLIAVETARGSGDFRMRFLMRMAVVLKCAATECGVFAGMDMKMDLQAQCSELRLTRELLSARKFWDANTEVLMNRPSVMELDKEITVWDVQSGCNRVYRCDYVELGEPGVPHAVLEYNGLSRIVTYAGVHTADGKEVDSETNGGLVFRPENDEGILQLREIGRAIRKSPCFPKGANVNFYEFMDDGRVLEMTFERGVEDFTYAWRQRAALLWRQYLQCGEGLASAEVKMQKWKKI